MSATMAQSGHYRVIFDFFHSQNSLARTKYTDPRYPDIFAISTCLPRVVEQACSLLTAPGRKLFHEELLWCYRHQFHNFQHSDEYYRDLYATQRVEIISDIQNAFADLFSKLEVVLTTKNADSMNAFVLTQHDHQKSLQLFVTTSHFTNLGSAKTFEGQASVIFALFVTIYHEMGHLLGRYLHGPIYQSPPCANIPRVRHSQAPLISEHLRLGEGGEIIELELWGYFLSLIPSVRYADDWQMGQDEPRRYLSDNYMAQILAGLVSSNTRLLETLPLVKEHHWVTIRESQYRREKFDLDAFSSFPPIFTSPPVVPPTSIPSMYPVSPTARFASSSLYLSHGSNLSIISPPVPTLLRFDQSQLVTTLPLCAEDHPRPLQRTASYDALKAQDSLRVGSCLPPADIMPKDTKPPVGDWWYHLVSDWERSQQREHH